MDIALTATPKEQHNLFFSGTNDAELRCVGHLRGDFGSNGCEFWTTWWPHQAELRTKTFADVLDAVVNELRSRDRVLKDRSTMAAFCSKHPEAEIHSWLGNTYGFVCEQGEYTFFLRCFPGKGDYNFYIYCYAKLFQKTDCILRGCVD